MSATNEYKALELIRTWRTQSEALIRQVMALSDLQDRQCEHLLDAISDHAPNLEQWAERIGESDPIGDAMDRARNRYEESAAAE